MPNKAIYWDACVFLSYVNGDRPERLQEIDPLLDQARKGLIDIFTSMVSVVEVAFGKVEQQGQQLDHAVEAKIGNLWGPAIKRVEFYSLIAEDAKQLMREGLPRGWRLTPLDASHLATARRIDVDEFHTYDRQLFKYADMLDFPIDEPKADQPQLPERAEVSDQE